MKVRVFTDGGARGNPGIAGYGIYVENDKGEQLHKESRFLGIKTNNEAEYLGLIAALEWVKENNIEEAEINSDSQLIVRQMKGLYKVKAEHLKKLWEKSQELCRGKQILFKEIPRENNKKADMLANLAMDRKK